MGLKEAIAGRAERIVTREVPGIGAVRIKRMSAAEVRALPEADHLGGEQVRATIMKDESDEPFFATVEEAQRDAAIFTALLKASNAENRLDVEAAAKK